MHAAFDFVLRMVRKKTETKFFSSKGRRMHIGKACQSQLSENEDNREGLFHSGGDDDYTIQMAVGQCPETCIHFVTEDQRLELERLMER